jgi:hypothetical protein
MNKNKFIVIQVFVNPHFSSWCHLFNTKGIIIDALRFWKSLWLSALCAFQLIYEFLHLHAPQFLY